MKYVVHFFNKFTDDGEEIKEVEAVDTTDIVDKIYSMPEYNDYAFYTIKEKEEVEEGLNTEYWDLDGHWDYDWQLLRTNGSLDLYQGMDKYGESVYILVRSEYDPDYESAEYVTQSYHDAYEYFDADSRSKDEEDL